MRCSCLWPFADNQDADFVEQPHGQGHETEGEDIGGGGDDGCYNEQGHDDVAAVMAHHPGIDEAHAAQYPADDGYFGQDAHGEGNAHQGIHVGLQGDGVGHCLAHLVAAEETEYQWKDEEIAEQYAEHEHDVSGHYQADGVAPLVAVESGGDKVEEQIDEVGQGEHHTGTERGFHVEQKLLGQPCVDELHGYRVRRYGG